MLAAGRQIGGVKRPQQRLLLDSRVETFDQPAERRVATDLLVDTWLVVHAGMIQDNKTRGKRRETRDGRSSLLSPVSCLLSPVSRSLGLVRAAADIDISAAVQRVDQPHNIVFLEQVLAPHIQQNIAELLPALGEASQKL